MQMKKIFALVMALTLVLGLMTGCGSKNPKPAAPAAPAAPSVPDTSTHVSDVQELLDAIKPGAVITLEPGTYNFSDFLGEEADMEGDFWYIGYEGALCLNGIKGLTLQAEDASKVQLQNNDPYSPIIEFNYAREIVLKNMTLGHNVEKGSCTGSVLFFNSCEDITAEGLDLYGCGTYGVEAMQVTGLQIVDSTIRECTYGITYISDSSQVAFKNCNFKDNEGYSMIDAYRTQVAFEDCKFENNTDNGMYSEFYEFFETGESGSFVQMKGCQFGEKETDSILNIGYPEGEILFDKNCKFTQDVEIDEVHVSSVEELLDAVAPGAVILVEPGKYNISEYLYSLDDIDEFNFNHEYVYIEDVFDGMEVRFAVTDGLSIQGNCTDPADVEIVIDASYAAVFNFEYAYGVSLANMTLGHTVTGECYGPVVNFDCVDGAALVNMDLYGCGVEGYYANNCSNITAFDTTIRDCSWGTASIYGSTGDFTFLHCVFKDNGNGLVADCDRAFFYNCIFEGNPAQMSGMFGENVYVETAFDNYTSIYSEEYSDYYPDIEPSDYTFDFTANLAPTSFDKMLLTETGWNAITWANLETGEAYYTEDMDVWFDLVLDENGLTFTESTGYVYESDWFMDSDYSFTNAAGDINGSVFYDETLDESPLYMLLYIGDVYMWLVPAMG